MLRWSSRLYAGPQGLSVEGLADPADEWFEQEELGR